ncbi:MAG: type II secretion system major pseudopilin GspG [Planctomycetales bacterium]|nr:type II secretion system major pseudopilin GspG [Planctomycetales bacterium]
MKIRPNRRRRHVGARRRGFTLMEVLLVLAILAILGTLVGVAFTRMQRRGYEGAARAQVNSFKSAFESYHLDFARYPNSLQDLRARPSGPDGDRWKGPYLNEDIPRDPWGQEYQYKQVDDGYGEMTYYVFSMGPDGQADTDDDISNRPAK